MGDEREDSQELTERIITPMSKQMVADISDYRFAARCETRSEAIRRLIRAGLNAERERNKR
jgi:metal-responsive CopG/Arc/MetJ family transcriptional regulator